MSLKGKTITGLIWSFIDNFSKQGITFIVGIILARLLTPKEFGLIGLTTVFIAVSNSIINSGFSQALIRKQDCTQTDYSTVFYINLALGVLLFIILTVCAPMISVFLNEPEFAKLLQVVSIVLIINALTIIQRTTLTKRIDFKLQTKVSIYASILSGIIGISMAFLGFGVWSLVAKTICQSLFESALLWYWNKWKPNIVFSLDSFKQLFSFGSKILISGLISTLYQNIYYLVIGKYFSTQELGFYSRANQFKNLPSKNLNTIIARVSYPVLSQLQDNPEKLKASYKKLVKSTMFITFILMLGLAAIAEPMIITLIGEKWRNSIIYLQILSFIGMMYPLHALNLNILNVQGRSDIFLKLEIIKSFLAIPAIVIGVFFGIKIMILGMLVNSIISYYLNSSWSGRFLNYTMKYQIIDILPSFLIASLMAVLVYIISKVLPFSYMSILAIQLIFGGVFIISICEIIKFNVYLEIKEIIINQIKKMKKNEK